MDQTGKRFRYSFSDPRVPEGTFITKPEIDSTKLSDGLNDSESSDYESDEDEIKSLKERNKSEYDEKHSDADETQNLQQLDSFQESGPNEYSDTYRHINDRNVSIDAISLKQQRYRLPKKSPGKSNDLPDPPKIDIGEQFAEHIYSPSQLLRSNSGKAIFFDAIVVYSENDMAAVKDFVEIVKGLVHSRLQYEPDIEFYDQGRFCSSNVSIAEDILNKASVVFIYLSKYVNNEYFDLIVDEAVSLSRLGLNPGHVMSGRRSADRQWALRPVHSLPMQQRDYKTPAGLVSIRGIDWFNKDTAHTKETIISIMREAKRIREEAERRQLLAYSQPPNLKKILTARHLISYQPQTMAYVPTVPYENANSGNVTIKFRPSAMPSAPGVMHQSIGSPYNQPSPLDPNQQMYGLQQNHEMNVRQNPTGRTYPSLGQAFIQAPLPQNIQQPHPHMPPLRQSNVQTPLPGTRPFRVQQPSCYVRSNNESLRLESSRRHRTRQRHRNESESSESESSSGDDESDDLDFVPAKLKKKRNINIIGCRYVQLGSNNQVLDGPVLPTKKTKTSTSKQANPARRGTPPQCSESMPCLEDEELEKQQKRDANDVKMVVKEQPLEPQVPTSAQRGNDLPLAPTCAQRGNDLPLAPTSAQGFHSSVTEDNLDLSNRANSNVNTNMDSSSSHKASSHKDLTLDQFSGTSMTKSDIDTNNYHNSKQLNVQSVPDKVLNLTLKNEEELQEYQLTVKGKQKADITDDFDKSDSDNEKVSGDSDSKRTVQLVYKSDSDNEAIGFSDSKRTVQLVYKSDSDNEVRDDAQQNDYIGSNGNDSFILPEDTDLFGDGPQVASDLDKSNRNNEKVLGDSVTERNVIVDSSVYENKNLTEDEDLCEDGPHIFGMPDQPYGELFSIPNLQSMVSHRQQSIKFMDVTRSLQSLSSAVPSKPSNVNVSEPDRKEDDELD